MSRRSPAVVAVVPVKPLALAKSRLDLPVRQRRHMALAFALDTISALSSSRLVSAVVVVTSDRTVAGHLRRTPVRVVADEADGLDAAVRLGVRAAGWWWPGAGVAVTPADLPCLRAVDVDEVLSDPAPAGGAYVSDRRGLGTTLVVYPPGREVVTRYGPGSAAAHADLGLEVRPDAPVRARQDVDTLEDLDLARALGLGPASAAAAGSRSAAMASTVVRTPRQASSPAAHPVTPTTRHTSTRWNGRSAYWGTVAANRPASSSTSEAGGSTT